MSLVQVMVSFLGSSGDTKLDFIIFSIFALFLIKMLMGFILKLFDK